MSGSAKGNGTRDASRSAPWAQRYRQQGEFAFDDDMLLDASTLHGYLDLLRLEDFSTMIVCTAHFVDAYKRLGMDGVAFFSLPA